MATIYIRSKKSSKLVISSKQIISDSGGGGGSFTYNILIDGVDTGTDVTIDGTNVTINLI